MEDGVETKPKVCLSQYDFIFHLFIVLYLSIIILRFIFSQYFVKKLNFAGFRISYA